MAVNQAEADKEIRSQLVSTLESGHNHMALAEATKAFPTSGINSRLPRVPYSFWHLVEHIRLSQKDMLDYMTGTSYEEPPFRKATGRGRALERRQPSGGNLSSGSIRIWKRSSGSSGIRPAISS